MHKHTFIARWSFSAKKAGVFQADFTEQQKYKKVTKEKHHPDVSESDSSLYLFVYSCVIVQHIKATSVKEQTRRWCCWDGMHVNQLIPVLIQVKIHMIRSQSYQNVFF